ncbi:MAG TPA: putative sugar O-methyltransferase [Planctomycetota bacterium]|nr:putative sugar O-methyltransferase [Planctomycetota bacterium]
MAQRYLGEVFPQAKIFRFRPFDTFDQVREEYDRSELCFLMPDQLDRLPDGTFDLFVNVSSLHEMTRDQIAHYYRIIGKQARYFYTKQWITRKNPDDGIVVSSMMYPTPEHWKVLDADIPQTNRCFVETVFAVR